MTERRREALLIEYDGDLMKLEEAVLCRGGFDVVVKRDREEAVAMLSSREFDAIVLSSPDRRGRTPLLHWLTRNQHPARSRVVVLTTAPHDRQFLRTAEEAGVCCVLRKPFTVEQLLLAAETAAAEVACRHRE